jgi:hypothetical protein
MPKTEARHGGRSLVSPLRGGIRRYDRGHVANVVLIRPEYDGIRLDTNSEPALSERRKQSAAPVAKASRNPWSRVSAIATTRLADFFAPYSFQLGGKSTLVFNVRGLVTRRHSAFFGSNSLIFAAGPVRTAGGIA